MRMFRPPEPDGNGDTWFQPPYDFWDHLDIATGQVRAEFYTPDFGELRVHIGRPRVLVDDTDEESWVTLDDEGDWFPDARDGESWRLPYKDGSVSEIACYQFLTKLPPWAVIRTLAEFERVLEDDGVATIIVRRYPPPLMGDTYGPRTTFGTDTLQSLIEVNEWNLELGMNVLIGQTEQTLMLYSQLVKRPR
jgi:hypothetical protein